MKRPPQQQAVPAGDHADPGDPGLVTCALFVVGAVLIGMLAMWLLLHSTGML